MNSKGLGSSLNSSIRDEFSSWYVVISSAMGAAFPSSPCAAAAAIIGVMSCVVSFTYLPPLSEKGEGDKGPRRRGRRGVERNFLPMLSACRVYFGISPFVPRLGSGSESSTTDARDWWAGNCSGTAEGKKETNSGPYLATALQLTFVAGEPERRGPSALWATRGLLSVSRAFIDGLEVLIIVRW